MVLSTKQISRCNKLIYIIVVVVTVLFTIRNIQSCIDGNLIGSIVALVTPFNEDLTIDEEGFRQNIIIWRVH